MGHRRIKTTREVWAVIHASHQGMRVFSSYSNPTGGCELGNGKPEMLTEYGLDGSPIPLIGCRTTWERGEQEYQRVNEKHEFWICVPIEEDD